MVAPLYTAVLLIGLGHHPQSAGCCDVCGVETAAVAAEISQLQTCPRWRERDRAARVLRKVDWRCHPEVVDALAYTLLHDCDEEVREEAAESLAKLRACMPVAHEALKVAAACDPDHATRHWARKGLANLTVRCEGACTVCGPPVVVPGAVIGPVPIEEPALSPLTPTILLTPEPATSPSLLTPLPAPAPEPSNELRLDAPADLPALAPGSSPFSAATPAPARSISARAPVPAQRLPEPSPAPLRPLRRVMRMIPGPNYAAALLGRRVADDRDLARARMSRAQRGEIDRQDGGSDPSAHR